LQGLPVLPLCLGKPSRPLRSTTKFADQTSRHTCFPGYARIAAGSRVFAKSLRRAAQSQHRLDATASKMVAMLLHAADREQRLDAGLRLRFRVWRQRARLDAAVADGADPARNPATSLRAQQLTQRSTRSAIARTIGNLLDAAEEPPESWGGYGPRPPLQREPLLGVRHELVDLAEQLRGAEVLSPQGVALAARLVWDSASPVYAIDSGTTVAQWVDAIAEALNATNAH
jgi:hypothetical protein